MYPDQFCFGIQVSRTWNRLRQANDIGSRAIHARVLHETICLVVHCGPVGETSTVHPLAVAEQLAKRPFARGHSIEHLEYEAYPAMAELEMDKIVDEAATRWPGTRVAIAHRVGRLEIGDAAVVVVAASAHRGEAFEACRFAIDTLKVTVPIWKREVATDGAYWVDDHA